MLSAALEVKPLHETTEGRVLQILIYIISAHHNLFCLQNTCTSKQKLVNETNPRPQPLLSQAHGTRKTIRKSQKTLPRSRALHLYTAMSKAKPLYQSTLYSLGFFKTYHLPCVRACVCFPGRTLLELLIFGNVAVLYESKHATRFRGQPLSFFFSALVSSGLLDDGSLLPEGTHNKSYRTSGVGITVGRDGPQNIIFRDPRNTGTWLSITKASCTQVPGGLGRDFRRLSLCFRLSLLFILGKSQAEPRKIFISPPSPQPPRKRSGFGDGL